MLAYIKARLESFGHAVRGLRFLVQSERHARFHLFVSVVVVVLGLGLSISSGEWCAVALAIGLVWTAEALNTAIERAVDLSNPDHHPLAGEAKDLAAGAVLMAATTAAIVGLIVFLPRIWQLM